MAGVGPRRFGLLVVVSFLVAVSIGGVVLAPQLAPSLLARNGALARAKRKLVALRAFALFRAPGDRAVLHAGDPPPRAGKRPAPGH